MINFRSQSVDGYGDRDDIALERDRQYEQIKDNQDAMRFRDLPYSNPSADNGEASLSAINNALLDAIQSGETQYATAIYNYTFANIEAYLENAGCSCGAWSYLEVWFDDFAIAAGIGDPQVEDLDAPGSDKLTLCFTWSL